MENVNKIPEMICSNDVGLIIMGGLGAIRKGHKWVNKHVISGMKYYNGFKCDYWKAPLVCNCIDIIFKMGDMCLVRYTARNKHLLLTKWELIEMSHCTVMFEDGSMYICTKRPGLVLEKDAEWTPNDTEFLKYD